MENETTSDRNDDSNVDRHWDENKKELEIMDIVKDCLMNFGDVEDVISELRRFQLGEPPPRSKCKSVYEIGKELQQRMERGDRLTTETAERYRLLKAVESLLNHALDMKDWERVGIAIDVLEELRETSFQCEPIKDVWNEKLKLAYDLF
jgi:hypothetical protein